MMNFHLVRNAENNSEAPLVRFFYSQELIYLSSLVT